MQVNLFQIGDVVLAWRQPLSDYESSAPDKADGNSLSPLVSFPYSQFQLSPRRQKIRAKLNRDDYFRAYEVITRLQRLVGLPTDLIGYLLHGSLENRTPAFEACRAIWFHNTGRVLSISPGDNRLLREFTVDLEIEFDTFWAAIDRTKWEYTDRQVAPHVLLDPGDFYLSPAIIDTTAESADTALILGDSASENYIASQALTLAHALQVSAVNLFLQTVGAPLYGHDVRLLPRSGEWAMSYGEKYFDVAGQMTGAIQTIYPRPQFARFVWRIVNIGSVSTAIYIRYQDASGGVNGVFVNVSPAGSLRLTEVVGGVAAAYALATPDGEVVNGDTITVLDLNTSIHVYINDILSLERYRTALYNGCPEFKVFDLGTAIIENLSVYAVPPGEMTISEDYAGTLPNGHTFTHPANFAARFYISAVPTGGDYISVIFREQAVGSQYYEIRVAAGGIVTLRKDGGAGLAVATFTAPGWVNLRLWGNLIIAYSEGLQKFAYYAVNSYTDVTDGRIVNTATGSITNLRIQDLFAPVALPEASGCLAYSQFGVRDHLDAGYHPYNMIATMEATQAYATSGGQFNFRWVSSTQLCYIQIHTTNFIRLVVFDSPSYPVVSSGSIAIAAGSKIELQVIDNTARIYVDGVLDVEELDFDYFSGAHSFINSPSGKTDFANLLVSAAADPRISTAEHYEAFTKFYNEVAPVIVPSMQSTLTSAVLGASGGNLYGRAQTVIFPYDGTLTEITVSFNSLGGTPTGDILYKITRGDGSINPQEVLDAGEFAAGNYVTAKITCNIEGEQGDELWLILNCKDALTGSDYYAIRTVTGNWVPDLRFRGYYTIDAGATWVFAVQTYDVRWRFEGAPALSAGDYTVSLQVLTNKSSGADYIRWLGRDTFITDYLLGFWDFSESYDDQHVNGLDFTPTGGVSLDGDGAVFDGTGYLSSPDTPVLDFSNTLFYAWVVLQMDEVDDNQYFFYQWNFTNDLAWIIFADTDNQIYFFISDDGTSFYGVTSTVYLTPGQRHFVDVSYDGAELRIDVNGVSTTTPLVTTIFDNSQDVIFGNQVVGTIYSAGICNGIPDESERQWIRNGNRGRTYAELNIYRSGTAARGAALASLETPVDLALQLESVNTDGRGYYPLLRPMPDCQDIFPPPDTDGWVRRVFDDNLFLYGSDRLSIVNDFLPPGYPATGYFEDFTSEHREHNIFANPVEWNAPPLSVYRIRNASAAGIIQLNIVRESDVWFTRTESTILDIDELNTQLSAAGLDEIADEDIIILGDVFYKPGFILRADGTIISGYMPVTYYAWFPGMLAPGLTKVTPESEGYCEISQFHLFRRL